MPKNKLPPLPTHKPDLPIRSPPSSALGHANHNSISHPQLNSRPGSNSNLNGVVSDKGRPTFGVDLAEQMARDNVEVPLIMAKCCIAIEKHGLRNQGVYRVSGTTSKIAGLRARLDKGERENLFF